MIELDKRAKNMNILIDGSPYYNDGFYIEGGQYSHLHVIRKEIKDGEPLSKIVKKLEKIISDEDNFDKKIQEEAKQLKIQREQKAIQETKEKELLAKKAMIKEERKEKIKKIFGFPTKQDEKLIENQFDF